MILFDGLPVPSTLFLFMCTCFSCEHVWYVIGRNVRARDPLNVRDLERSVVDEWDRLPQRVCLDYVASMRSRCRAVINARGGHTRYNSNIQTEIFPSRNVRYKLTHYLQCIHKHNVVNVCVSAQTFQDPYINLLIL